MKEECTATDTTHLDEMIDILSLKTKWKLLASTVLLLATTTTPHCSAHAKACFLDHCVETYQQVLVA